MQVAMNEKKRKPSRIFLVSVSFVLLFIVSPQSLFAQDSKPIDALRQMGKAFAQIAAKTSPAVVGIQAEKQVVQQRSRQELPFGHPFDDDFFEDFFRQRQPRRRSPQKKSKQIAKGSGFIISSDGYILTNNHLVGQATKVTVKLEGKPEMEAEIIGTDPDSDIAVIKIDANDLPFLEMANSDALEVGEWVLAIGSPFGLSHTVTAGIVSAKGRSNVGLAVYEDFIQTDAAINPGNSGGPLLNLDGEVVGINTAIISRSGGNMGIGLAIPINMAKNIYEQLVAGGTVVRGFLGVGNQDLNEKLAAYFGLEDTKGVVITEIVKDSAAEKAGLEQGDIIVEFDGKTVEKAYTFRSRVAVLKPDTEVKVVVLRDGKRKTFTVKLGERPVKKQISDAKSESLEQLGFDVQELTDELAEKFKYKGLAGVVVDQVESGSLAALAGIRPDLLVQEVNRQPVTTIEEFNNAVEKAVKEGTILLLINNGRYNQFLILTLPEK